MSTHINEASAPAKLKRKKLLDKSLPSALEEIALVLILSPASLVDLPRPNSQENVLYQELQDMERSLDWTMTRKRMEINEAMDKPAKIRRKLRVFLSHSTSGQAWQEPLPSLTDGVDFDTGQGIPAWTFRIEGRLLDTPGPRLNKTPPRKFSSFLKSMVVEFDMDPALYAESNIVEWHRFPAQPPQDGFEIKRKGDLSIKARVLLHLEHKPEHFKVTQPLSDIISVKEDTRVGIVAALWNYIKINGLQDKVHPTTIKFDQKLLSIAQAAQAVRNSKLKRDFLLSFAENPQKFIQTWIASQARDLEVILGDDNRGVRDEDLRRSDFFRLPWVREAVQIYEGLRSSGSLKPR
ncbi:SWI/SNF complex component snf12 [Tulasnella sp. 403]|nr:SWI/SNF complex component snf12 [Tulasnella sp. 403]